MAIHHLAQLNIATMRGALDSPVMADFVAGLDEINAIAERSRGYVWRLETDDGNATALRPFGDDVLVNLSLWTGLEELRSFVFDTMHAQFLRRRREWFERMDAAFVVLWWVPDGTRPTVDDARARLELLRTQGPSPEAFTIRTPFPPPSR